MKIALSGKMMSGKTIVADYLVSKYGFIEIAFADRLKELAIELFGMNPEYKNRELLQLLGMKMRELDPNVWVRYVMNELLDEQDVVVSDVRLKNEFDALQQAGFIMVRCYVSRNIQDERIQKEMPEMPWELVNHISETDLDDIGQIWSGRAWHHSIINDGCTMGWLLKQVDGVIKCERTQSG